MHKDSWLGSNVIVIDQKDVILYSKLVIKYYILDSIYHALINSINTIAEGYEQKASNLKYFANF